ncbi:hypothetical protein F4805DRAFT_419345 [Annulohypoxylon moriforme]|nr:hypothetical protein F4805DRAFT_419345 [Annulohypoxylon moriforme]
MTTTCVDLTRRTVPTNQLPSFEASNASEVTNPPPDLDPSSSSIISHTPVAPYSQKTKDCPVTIRPAKEPTNHWNSLHSEVVTESVSIYHPAYATSHPLLRFQRSDNGGVDYGLVYYACCIIAGNIWKDDEGCNERRIRETTPSHRHAGPDAPEISLDPPLLIPTEDRVRPTRGRPRKGSSIGGGSVKSAALNSEAQARMRETQVWAQYSHARPFLSTSTDPGDFNAIVAYPGDGILREANYYFHFCEHRDHIKYPIVSKFYDWLFPHDRVPCRWASMPEPSSWDQTQSLEEPGWHCRFSAQLTKNETAHIVPSAENNWFGMNKMTQYAKSAYSGDGISATSNLMRIRADLHRLFDACNFTVFPKRTSPSSQEFALCIHSLHSSTAPSRMTTESALVLLDDWHNVRVGPIPWIQPNFLFARFAWSLFNPNTMAILRSTQLKVLIYEPVVAGKGWDYKVNTTVMKPKADTTKTGSSRGGEGGSGAPYENDALCDDPEIDYGPLAGLRRDDPPDPNNLRLSCLYDYWSNDDHIPRRDPSVKRESPPIVSYPCESADPNGPIAERGRFLLKDSAFPVNDRIFPTINGTDSGISGLTSKASSAIKVSNDLPKPGKETLEALDQVVTAPYDRSFEVS